MNNNGLLGIFLQEEKQYTSSVEFLNILRGTNISAFHFNYK